MKNAEWTPAMVERTARKIRKIESEMSLSAFLISSVTGIATFFGFIDYLLNLEKEKIYEYRKN